MSIDRVIVVVRYTLVGIIVVILRVAAIPESALARIMVSVFVGRITVVLVQVGITRLGLCGKGEGRSLRESEAVVVLSGQVVGPLVIGKGHYRPRSPCCKVDALRELS